MIPNSEPETKINFAISPGSLVLDNAAGGAILELLRRRCPVSIFQPRVITGAVAFVSLPCLDNAAGRVNLEPTDGVQYQPRMVTGAFVFLESSFRSLTTPLAELFWSCFADGVQYQPRMITGAFVLLESSSVH